MFEQILSSGCIKTVVKKNIHVDIGAYRIKVAHLAFSGAIQCSFQVFKILPTTRALQCKFGLKIRRGAGHSPGPTPDDEVLNLNICSKNDFKSTCSDCSPIEFVMRPSTHSGHDGGVIDGSFLQPSDFSPFKP